MITDEECEAGARALCKFYYQSEDFGDLWYGYVDAARSCLDAYKASRPRLPKAMTEAPENGAEYWLCSPLHRPTAQRMLYSNRAPYDARWLALGLCYATEAEAITVANAMLALVRP